MAEINVEKMKESIEAAREPSAYERYYNDVVKYLQSKLPDEDYSVIADISAFIGHRSAILVNDALDKNNQEWRRSYEKSRRSYEKSVMVNMGKKLTFDLLIVYRSGEKQIVKDISHYGFKDYTCFYVKNGETTVLRLSDVICFGRKEFFE